ncbi:MAG TPA: hypothetical protein VMU92_02455 [Acidobacteriaceae bacterium]|nr:hypothetical protein [Acidobacteriaceae bacterium]
MRQRRILSLRLLLVLVSPLAIAQTSPFGDSTSGQQTTPVDCTDPLLANSSMCQNQAAQQSQQGTSQETLPRITPSSVPQPGMTLPQTFNDVNNPNRSQLSQYQNSPNQKPLHQKPLPPQPLTQFQKFVAGTTGEVLPIFGENLFQSAPSTFAPLNETPVPPGYTIGPGDELRKGETIAGLIKDAGGASTTASHAYPGRRRICRSPRAIQRQRSWRCL